MYTLTQVTNKIKIKVTYLSEHIAKKIPIFFISISCCFPAALTANDNEVPVPTGANISVGDFQGSIDPALATITHDAVSNTLNVNQVVDKAVLPFDSFNIGANATADFKHPDVNSLSVIPIGQGSASQIYGQLKSVGRLFLINQNGIVFNEGSQSYLGGAIISSLEMSQDAIDNGILSPFKKEQAAFSAFTDANGNVISGDVIIKDGAEINISDGGQFFVFAPNVKNNGVIQTPDGQTILAAGEKVYLQASEDPNLRGLLIEIDNGGEVRNLGEIIADRGNVTLIGLVVNQSNRISASTTTSSNGSIRLLARDNAQLTNTAGNIEMDATNTGDVIIGDDSITEILAELENTSTAIDDQSQYKSQVEIMGKKIHLQENSLISAKGGEVNITATDNPFQDKQTRTTPELRKTDVIVQMESGSRIDVSGNSAEVEMSRNNITVELRGNELKDLPLQRDGALRGESVVIDVRKADQFQLGDISGNLATVERNVAERTSEGGIVNVQSKGDIRFLQGAEVDVSGGEVKYKAGEVKSTILLDANNQLVDIHDADPNVLYNGVAEITSINEAGYIEGKNAGTVLFAAKGIIADGTLTGNTVQDRVQNTNLLSRFQRTVDSLPKGGELIIGLEDGQELFDYQAPSVTIQDKNLSETVGSFDIGIDDSITSIPEIAAADNNLFLSTDFINTGKFTQVNVNSNGKISIADDATLNLKANSTIKLKGESISIDKSLKSNGGVMDFVSTIVDSLVDVSSSAKGLFIDNNVVLDVSGNWTNDFPQISGTADPKTAVVLDGGNISLVAEERQSVIKLGDSVALLTLGGAQRDVKGNLTYGRGGDVTITLEEQNIGLDIGKDNYILGYGPDGGGSLTFNANGIQISDLSEQEWMNGQTVAQGGVTRLADFLFSDTGFSQFNISSNQGDFTIDSDVRIDMKTSNLFLPANVLNKRSGSLASVLAGPGDQNTLPFRESGLQSGLLNHVTDTVSWFNATNYTGYATQFNRKPQEVNFAITGSPGTQRNDFVFSEGASIIADPGGSITMSNNTGGLINFGGTIDAPAADVTLNLQRKSNQAFDASHSIFMDSNARINVSGTSVSLPDPVGFKRGRVFDAGEVSISSSGYIVSSGKQYNNAGDLVGNGMTIDVSGTSASFDVTGGVSSTVTERKVISGSAGSITFSSAEGIIDDGTNNLVAANTESYGGKVSYEINQNIRGGINPGLGSSFPTGERKISLSQSLPQQLSDPDDAISGGVSYAVGDAIDSGFNGVVALSADNLNSNGADQLFLKNDLGRIEFLGDVNLSKNRDIFLDTAIINSDGGQIDLNANYVSLGSTVVGTRNANSPNPTNGTGSLNVEANLIDLVGLLTLQGFGNVNVNSHGDVRTRGVTNQVAGEFAMRGALQIAADQIYPTTMSRFFIDAGDAGQITILPGEISSTALSAAGNLTFHAGDILQQGVVRAPTGQIRFDAVNSVVLDEGSITSVSSEGQSLLLGRTQNGTQWVYSATGNTSNFQTLYSANRTNAPVKQVELSGDDLQVNDGASIDLTGGGEVITYEFVPGPGGSKDFLLAENANNLFAVLPTLGTGTPYDSQEFAGWNLSSAESVYLSGGNGLPAGTYTKLPARYALLPGAFLVESVDGFEHIPLDQTAVLDNGTLVAGYTTITGTTIKDSTTTGFIVRPGSYANELSEFDVNNADELVTKIAGDNDHILPRLVRDAGSLSIGSQSNIELNGNLLTAAVEGARGALVDISADIIQIVNNKTGINGIVELKADSLNALNAESLLVGGSREFTSNGTEVSVKSTQVSTEDGVALTSPEIILAAKNRVDLKEGSSLSSSGVINAESETLLLDGDSALARVSAAPQVKIERTNVNGTANLYIENGSTLSSDNSITLDSSGNIILDGDVQNATGGSLALGGSDISIGDVVGGSGLILDDAKLASYAGLDLSLRSSGDIRFFGTAEMNQANLEFIGNGLIADQASSADVSINADSISFGNEFDVAPATEIQNPNGQIVINTNQFNLKQGEFVINGFNSLGGEVKGDIVGQGNSVFKVNGDLDLASAGITALTGSDIRIESSGDINLQNSSPVGSNNGTTEIAAKLDIVAQSISLDTKVNMRVGDVELLAENGDVTLGNNADIDVSGYSIDVPDISQINIDGGEASLVSKTGNIQMDVGSRINVSSGGTGSNAGLIEFLAQQGDVNVEGQLLADARAIDADETGGHIRVDSKTIGKGTNPQNQTGFKDLNSLLNSGGFTGSRDIRLHEGDIVVDAGDTIKANQIILTAEGTGVDDGNIIINGSLGTTDKSNGGKIDLNARKDIVLNTGSILVASATRDVENGKVTLNSETGSLDLNLGSEIVTGDNGNVLLRASRTVGDNDIMIEDLDSTINANDISIEAVEIYDSVATINTSQIATIKNDTDGFMQNADTIENRLNVSTDDRYHLRPGVEIRNDGDITLADDWDLSAWRFNGEPGNLTIRATGDIFASANLSDGIKTEITTIPNPNPFLPPVTTSVETVQKDKSWSFKLVAGADKTSGGYSADTLRTNDLADGDVILANDKTIRTGTGDIAVLAANDVVLSNIRSTIYTLGRQSGNELDRRAEGTSLQVTKLVPTDGGDLSIKAGNNILGPGSVSDKTQFINEWYVRQNKIDFQKNPFTGAVTSVDEDAGTWIDYQNFQQGVAALGGGDINISAGNNITRLSVSAPTTVSRDHDTDDVQRFGNGNLNVTAKGDIRGGIFFIGDGEATISADGSIIHGRYDPSNPSFPREMDTIVALMGGTVNIDARDNIAVDAVYNPTLMDFDGQPLFSTYTDSSSVSAKSLVGDIYMDGGITDIENYISNSFVNIGSTLNLMPGNIQFTAAKGDIIFDSGALTLLPDNDSSLGLYAGNNIYSSTTILASDTAKAFVPTILNPLFNTTDLKPLTLRTEHSDPPIHINDLHSSYVVADQGDIDGGRYFSSEQIRLDAGRDIKDIQLNVQNLRGSDITRVKAGRDVILDSKTDVIGVSGPGRLEVIAGRNIDLGPSVGIETRGNLTNPFLEEQGADVFVMAGVGEGPKYFDFFSEYFKVGAEYRDTLISFLNKQFNDPNTIDSFLAKSENEQWAEVGNGFIPEVISAYFGELRAAGRDTTGDFSRGYKAIDVLFPESQFDRVNAYDPTKLSLKLPGETNPEYFERLAGISDYSGDLSLFFSKIYSLDGGGINLLVPGGFVNAGLAAPPANAPDKAPGELGVVAQSFGDILTYSRGNFQVNQSRVSTLLGGDVTMWSSVGDIDAGRGSKTAISAPEPIITITDTGEIQVDLSNTVSGSGIRAVVIDPLVSPGDVDLIAPNGIVNAGDAGIATSGNLNIAAQAVIGADNIQFGGVAVGVPSASAGSVTTAGISGTGDVTKSATDEAVQAAQEDSSGQADDPVESAPQLSFISVEILGFGYDEVLEEEEEEEEEEENAEVSFIKEEATEELG